MADVSITEFWGLSAFVLYSSDVMGISFILVFFRFAISFSKSYQLAVPLLEK
jgi:hypothetical protein